MTAKDIFEEGDERVLFDGHVIINRKAWQAIKAERDEMIETFKKIRAEICSDCCDSRILQSGCKCAYTDIIDPILERATGKKIEEAIE